MPLRLKKAVLFRSNYIPRTFNLCGDVTMSYLLWGEAKFTAIHVALRHLIGASLSEPHTSVTALRTRVYVGRTIYLSMDRPHTVNFKWAYLNISWKPFVHVHAICPAHCRVGEGLLPERSVSVKEARGTKTTHAWQLRTMTDKGRLLTVQITHCSWVRFR